ncbi:MAG: holo-ACP synthase [bacterium]
MQNNLVIGFYREFSLIAGIGTDIVEVARLENKPALWKKFLSEKDFEYVGKFKNSLERIAGFWAAKEALVKALDDKTINFSSISIVHSESGKPFFENVPYDGTFHLSISHEKEFAVALVVWEKNET